MNHDVYESLENEMMNDHQKMAAGVLITVLSEMSASLGDSVFSVISRRGLVTVRSETEDGDVIEGSGPDVYLAVADFEESAALANELDDDGEGWKRGS